jgi:hypothetical protein
MHRITRQCGTYLSCTSAHTDPPAPPSSSSHPSPSGVVPTAAERGRFQRGHTDTFLYPRLPPLGRLTGLRVAAKGGGLFAAWHLRSVRVGLDGGCVGLCLGCGVLLWRVWPMCTLASNLCIRCPTPGQCGACVVYSHTQNS